MTMCVRGKPVTVAASSTERVCSEQHRVDEINLAEKFQSIGVGDPKRRWLVDSGATCHIISERWLSHYKFFFLLHAAKVRSSCEEGPGQSALQSAYHNPKLDVTELKQKRTP